MMIMMMKILKMNKHKKRSKNLRGDRNYDLCPCCGNANCDPAHSSGNKGFAMTKIQNRLKNGLCMGC